MLACLPSNLVLVKNPSAKNFLLSLFVTSLSFFLYSFHVHEKQMLLPMLIFGLQALTEFKPFASIFGLAVNFSMFHLFVKDNNHVNYVALNLIWMVVVRQLETYSLRSYNMTAVNIIVYKDNYKLNIAE